MLRRSLHQKKRRYSSKAWKLELVGTGLSSSLTPSQARACGQPLSLHERLRRFWAAEAGDWLTYPLGIAVRIFCRAPPIPRGSWTVSVKRANSDRVTRHSRGLYRPLEKCCPFRKFLALFYGMISFGGLARIALALQQNQQKPRAGQTADRQSSTAAKGYQQKQQQHSYSLIPLETDESGSSLPDCARAAKLAMHHGYALVYNSNVPSPHSWPRLLDEMIKLLSVNTFNAR